MEAQELHSWTAMQYADTETTYLHLARLGTFLVMILSPLTRAPALVLPDEILLPRLRGVRRGKETEGKRLEEEDKWIAVHPRDRTTNEITSLGP
jgi:hypothetical protein